MDGIEKILDGFAKCFSRALSDYGYYKTEKARAARQIRDALIPQGDEDLRDEIDKSIRDTLQDFDQYSPCLHKALLEILATTKSLEPQKGESK